MVSTRLRLRNSEMIFMTLSGNLDFGRRNRLTFVESVHLGSLWFPEPLICLKVAYAKPRGFDHKATSATYYNSSLVM